MAIFTNDNKQLDGSSTSSGGATIIATGTTIKGEIDIECRLHIDGYVEGDVTCNGKIVIGQKGVVKGNIISVNAEIHGEIIGSVKISEKLILKSSGLITGDIVTSLLEIEPNARFNGNCSMTVKE